MENGTEANVTKPFCHHFTIQICNFSNETFDDLLVNIFKSSPINRKNRSKFEPIFFFQSYKTPFSLFFSLQNKLECFHTFVHAV